MNLAKVFGTGYDSEGTVEDFGVEYYAIAPRSNSLAEILLFVRTDDKRVSGSQSIQIRNPARLAIPDALKTYQMTLRLLL